MKELRSKKTVELARADGTKKAFILSDLPYFSMRKVAALYGQGIVPKAGQYGESEEGMRLLFSFVAVDVGGAEVRLTTDELIENHVDDFQLGMRLEAAMLQKNTGFFGGGGRSGFLDYLLERAASSLTPTLMRLLEQLSERGWLPSESSEKK